MITLAVLIPDDGKYMAAIVHAIKTEVIPLVFRYEGIHYDAVVGLRTETTNARDYQVVEGRVVVITTAVADVTNI